MRNLALLAVGALVAAPAPVAAQAHEEHHSVDLQEWSVEWGGRPRDPYVAPDGKVWFVGQAGNYIGNFDPTTQAFRRYEIEEGTHPHNLLVDEQGIVWYAGHRNGRVGRLDPATGDVQVHMTGEANPHTQVFDGRGNIWFTSQNGLIGRLNMSSGKLDLVNPSEELPRTGPYGMDVDADGRAWVSLFATNMVAAVDPNTLDVKLYPTTEGGRVRRNAVTPDGMVWYVDYARGYLGRLDPATGETREWLAPGGERSQPYAITADDQGRVWVSETGEQKRIVGFDPRTEEFFSVVPVSNTVRHMMFHRETGTLWFGTDSNNLARIVTRNILP